MQCERRKGLDGYSRLTGFLPQGFGSPESSRVSRPTKVACGRIWPNGEFGLGYTKNKEQSDPFRPDRAGGVSSEAMQREAARIVQGGAEGLDLTSLRNSRKPPNRPESYGRKGLTGYGGKMVRNGGYVLQQRAPRRCLTFLTLTLPPMGPGAAQQVAESWGETVRLFLEWLGRCLCRQGLPKAVVSVTELQTERLRRSDAACLHLHAVFQGRMAGKSWAVSPKMVRAWWLRRLSKVTGGRVESLNCCDMKPVEKDAGNYLSKYMSKGVESIESYAELVGWKAVPRQWWNMTAACRSLVKGQTLSGETVMSLLDEAVHAYYNSGIIEGFKFVRAIEVQATEVQSFVVGYWGKLTRESCADFRALAGMLKSA